MTTTPTFASTYGTGAYDSSTYSLGSSSSTTTGSSNGGGASNLLTNTGFDVLLIVTTAATILLIALAVRIWKRSAKPALLSERPRSPQ